MSPSPPYCKVQSSLLILNGYIPSPPLKPETTRSNEPYIDHALSYPHMLFGFLFLFVAIKQLAEERVYSGSQFKDTILLDEEVKAAGA